ncbi:hypothetical protein G3545_18910 [Starkeya sp. ORNL1]|uniref:hypothetical protein n=1 Tax=Starkeya sp. ORNL1 TaxID=2709380 RepID=UPI001463119D|nr:hypothetical protein [Starkeya sp. ORNL1]QJP15542.1 hypothetical protein G3545_18910 [Starkeya sp. ORNL1]
MDRLVDGQRRAAVMRGRLGTNYPAHRPPVRSLAGKLHLTRIALGCSTNKELVSRFAAVNRATAFTSQNAYKWLSGKAMPRMSSVYEDWSQILGGKLAAPFIAACSFEEFTRALRQHFDIPEAAISELRGEPAPSLEEVPDGGWREDAGTLDEARRADAGGGELPRVEPARGDLWRGEARRRNALMAGNFLGVSPAWSRAQAGRLLIGAARIGYRRDDELWIDYIERVVGHAVHYAGSMVTDNRTVQSAMECMPTGRVYLLALQFPTFPANLIGGLLCGTVLHDPDARSVASRILFVRSHALDWDGLLARIGYATHDDATLARELEALGYIGGERAGEVAGQIVRFLAPPGESSGTIEAGPAELNSVGYALDSLTPL